MQGEWGFLRDLIMVVGVVTVVAMAVGARLKIHKMRFESLKASGMTNEDREVLRAVQQSIQRIENRLEALETLAMDREREEKFGMRL